MVDYSDIIKGIVEALLADSALTALVSDRIYTHIPQGEQNPCVLVEMDSAEWDTKTEDGEMATVTIVVFSEYRGLREVANVADAIVAALHRSQPALDSGDVVCLHRRSVRFLQDPDGLAYQARIDFMALVTE